MSEIKKKSPYIQPPQRLKIFSALVFGALRNGHISADSAAIFGICRICGIHGIRGSAEPMTYNGLNDLHELC